MYKKCENCYKDGKVPNEESCKKCEDDLKRKEQECEELKKELDFKKNMYECARADEKDKFEEILELKAENETLFKAIEEVNKINKELEAENERLKKEIRLYACIDKWGTEQCHCACRCLGNEFCDAAEGKMKNIKQTLADIKEIAEHCIKQDICTTCDYSDKCHIEDEEIPTYDVCKLILQKISEVKNVENN